MRNAYIWMTKPRLRGFQEARKGSYDTEFDRWMRHMNFNAREVCEAMDLPEARVRELRSGWRGGRINGGMVPGCITRYAMAALAAGLRPAPVTPECYDLVVRLGQAAFDVGLPAWPAGEVATKPPKFDPERQKTAKPERKPRQKKSPSEKRPGAKIKWSASGKRILSPREA